MSVLRHFRHWLEYRCWRLGLLREACWRASATVIAAPLPQVMPEWGWHAASFVMQGGYAEYLPATESE